MRTLPFTNSVAECPTRGFCMLPVGVKVPLAGSYSSADASGAPETSAPPVTKGTATASAAGTDIGDVGRSCLRGPRQVNLDFSLAKFFPVSESRTFEFRAEFFNLFNHPNFANPISNLNALVASGGSIDPINGQVVSAGNFGRIISTSNNPRIIQFALKFSF
jgi:hypothetical protein